MNEEREIETTTGTVRARVVGHHEAAELAIDKAKRLGKGDMWANDNELWLWPDDPRFKELP